jgi:dTDP-4-amino-4,6-dideoxygalactose transaminase
MQKAFAHLGYKSGDIPVSEQLGYEVLSLPNYPELTHDEVLYIANTLKDIVGTQTNSRLYATTVISPSHVR